MIEWAGVPQLAATLLRDVATPAVGIWLAVAEVLSDGPTDWGKVAIIGGMIGIPSLTFLDWRHRPTGSPSLPTGPGATGGSFT